MLDGTYADWLHEQPKFIVLAGVVRSLYPKTRIYIDRRLSNSATTVLLFVDLPKNECEEIGDEFVQDYCFQLGSIKSPIVTLNPVQDSDKEYLEDVTELAEPIPIRIYGKCSLSHSEEYNDFMQRCPWECVRDVRNMSNNKYAYQYSVEEMHVDLWMYAIDIRRIDPYIIATAVESAIKHPVRTVYAVFDSCKEHTISGAEWNRLSLVGRLIESNGGAFIRSGKSADEFQKYLRDTEE